MPLLSRLLMLLLGLLASCSGRQRLNHTHSDGSRCTPVPWSTATAAVGADKCPERHQMDIYIASGGGTGSNLLYSFLCKHGYALGSRRHDYGARWCHSLDPVTPDIATAHHIKRAIFLYSTDPVMQVESMYRQGYAEVNFRKKIGLPANAPHTFPKSFAAYCNQSDDLAHLEAQWEAWVTVAPHSTVSYPILAIQFEHLWKHLPELYRFVNLEETALPAFPRKTRRKSHGSGSGSGGGRSSGGSSSGSKGSAQKTESQVQSQTQLREGGCGYIYESLTKKISKIEEFVVIWDGTTYTNMDAFFTAYSSPPTRSPMQNCDPNSGWNGGRVNYHLYIKK